MKNFNIRRHFSVEKLPEPVVAAIHKMVLQGKSYPVIAAHVQELGHHISVDAITRYGRYILAQRERFHTASEMARAILGEGDTLALEEAATKLALNLILNRLLETEALKEDLDIYKTLTALASLQSSSVSRERLKLEMRKKADAALERIEGAGSNRLNPAILQRIREEVYGLVA